MSVFLCRRCKTNETLCPPPANDHANRRASHKWRDRDLKRSVATLSAGEALAGNGNIELPAITDYESVQLALSTVIHAVAAGTLDTARAKVLFYGLQIASANLRKLQACSPVSQTTRVTDSVEPSTKPAPLSADQPMRECDAPCKEDAAQAKNHEAAAPISMVHSDKAVQGNKAKKLHSHEKEETKGLLPARDDSNNHTSLSSACFSSQYDYKNEASVRLLARIRKTERRL